MTYALLGFLSIIAALAFTMLSGPAFGLVFGLVAVLSFARANGFGR